MLRTSSSSSFVLTLGLAFLDDVFAPQFLVVASRTQALSVLLSL